MRTRQIFEELKSRYRKRADRMFLYLLLTEWGVAVVLAGVMSPYTYDGADRSIHFHVKVALCFGAILNALPIALIVRRPGWWLTRHVVAVSQMMWSGILIAITGGRVETHFHIFGSLAFLAFYKDWKVIVTATLVVVLDHLARGLLWPDSLYGIANPEWWRLAEHSVWIAFEDVVLVIGCHRGLAELRSIASQTHQIQKISAGFESNVAERTQELSDAMEYFRALVENTDAVPFDYDPAQRKIIYIAPQAQRILGRDASGDTLFGEAIHPADRDRVTAILAELTTAASPTTTIDYRVVAADGRVIYVHVVLSARSEGAHCKGVAIDVTKQAQLQDELRQAQKLESIGRLSAGIAHEINTPMQFIGDSVRFVQTAVADVNVAFAKHREAVARAAEGDLSPDTARETAALAEELDVPFLVDAMPEALERAVEGIGRVSKIVHSMKAFSHPDGADMCHADLNSAVESTLVIARGEYKYIADVETELGAIPLVYCHVGEINQVILNLIVNAAHAIADKGAGGSAPQHGKIRVVTRQLGDRVEVAISDTGTGIPVEARDRVFDPFFTTKEVGKGTGQGLALARAVIVDKHHGTIHFETELGVGTTFFIRLPIDAVSETAVAA